jgi:hypothetical protein
MGRSPAEHEISPTTRGEESTSASTRADSNSCFDSIVDVGAGEKVQKNRRKERGMKNVFLKLEVINKETGKVVWIEEHETEEILSKAIKDLKENNFNPDFFKFNVKR